MDLEKFNYECQGQISLFDVICPPEIQEEPPILLSVGQTVYQVQRGDILEYAVYDEKSWLCGNNNRGYRLKMKDGCYGVVSNRSLGAEFFTEYSTAREAAEAYINNHDVMLGESIKAEEIVAYHYIRESDNREMKAFYARIGNGLLYVKEFMTYEHIVEDNVKHIKKFMEQPEFRYNNVNERIEQFDYIPKFKNMYPCRKDVDWMYASAEYSGCI